MIIFLKATVEGLSCHDIFTCCDRICIVYKAMDVLSFAQPALAVVGAGIISSLADRGLPFLPALLLAVILTGVLSLIIERTS